MFDSWTHFMYRLNDPNPHIRQIALDSIEENHHTLISRKIRIVKTNIIKFSIYFIIIIIVIIFIVKIIKNKIKYKIKNNE